MKKIELTAKAIRFEYPRNCKQAAIEAQEEIFDLLDAGWMQIHPTRLLGEIFRVVLIKVEEETR